MADYLIKGRAHVTTDYSMLWCTSSLDQLYLSCTGAGPSGREMYRRSKLVRSLHRNLKSVLGEVSDPVGLWMARLRR